MLQNHEQGGQLQHFFSVSVAQSMQDRVVC
jgi:hypothetical protein